MSDSPLVDVIIAVHSATRPIARAVASVLEHTQAAVRVTVIAHNIDKNTIIGNLGGWVADPRVRVLHLVDEIPSPAGPMNHGLDNATAPFVALLGSDDEFAPGAIDSWLRLQQETSADIVLARIQLVDGQTDPYPPVRWGKRTRDLDPYRDRLAYRSAPLGLVSTAKFGQLRFTCGLLSGEDLPYTLELFFSGAKIVYALNEPPYVGHDDVTDRVTFIPRPVEQDFAYLKHVLHANWFMQLAEKTRVTIIAKLLRLHVYGAITARCTDPQLFNESRAQLQQVVTQLLKTAPHTVDILPLADIRVLNLLASEGTTAAQMQAAVAARMRYLTLPALITSNPFYVLHSQAPLRTLLAGFSIMRRFRGSRV